MNDIIEQMLRKYPRRSVDEEKGALREILQEIALLGLWRGKFLKRQPSMEAQPCAFFMAWIVFQKIVCRERMEVIYGVINN